MSSYAEGQVHMLVDSLEKSGYVADDLTRLGQAGKEKLQQIQSFLLGHATIQFVKRIIVRTSFEPSLIGQGWTWWKGSTDGNGLEGEEDCDQRSLALGEVDMTQVTREVCLKEGESSITGHEKDKRLKTLTDRILLDPGFGWALYQEEGQKTLRWLYDTFGVTYLDFFGRILRNPLGNRFVLYLYRSCVGSWCWSVFWLGFDWGARRISAALPAK